MQPMVELINRPPLEMQTVSEITIDLKQNDLDFIERKVGFDQYTQTNLAGVDIYKRIGKPDEYFVSWNIERSSRFFPHPLVCDSDMLFGPRYQPQKNVGVQCKNIFIPY